MKPLEMFKKFVEDEQAWNMFITGSAGTGKTTSLDELTMYCEANKIPYAVCAHTHKACGVLRSKLSCNPPVRTLWSFLKKRPAVNTKAKRIKELNASFQHGDPDKTGILFIDEFSIIGEKDKMDIIAMQEPINEEDPHVKIVWIGDPKQLPPVQDQEAVKAKGPYWIQLKRIWRTDGPLVPTLQKLVSFIEGAPAEPLERHSAFIKTDDLVEAFKANNDNDKVILAWTNYNVQELNFSVAEKTAPDSGDMLFSPSLHEEFYFHGQLSPLSISLVDQRNGEHLAYNSKYKTLEFIVNSGLCEFYNVSDADGDEYIFPVIFGTDNYKRTKEYWAKEAVSLNARIEKEFKVDSAANWARANYNHELARKRAMAWRKFLTLNDNVYCFDFNYAMTVHKSQGSTFRDVYLDSADLSKCIDTNYDLYLRLFYVAISRASNSVTTNT